MVQTNADQNAATKRPRLSDLGLRAGILDPGPLNAITDVPHVLVGHHTLVRGSQIRTGVTAILPHGGNLFQEKVPAGLFVGNGFGKLMGGSQIDELGEIETPIVLTNTLSVAAAATAILDWTLARAGNEGVRSINAVVGETNDGAGGLNDIRQRALTAEMVRAAIERASDGPVPEGSIGAGTGTTALGWKGGIGTSSRRLSGALADYTVGVLVQSNFGGDLQMLGAPVGLELARDGGYYGASSPSKPAPNADGSIMMVVATDLPLSDRNLRRLAARTMAGLARTGASMSNGSGDYAIAFSTAETVQRTGERRAAISTYPEVANELMSLPFQAVIEATEEAILNSLLQAETVQGFRATAESLPLAPTMAILRRYGLSPTWSLGTSN